MGWWGSLRTRTALAPTVLWPTPPTSWWLESVRLWQWGCPDTPDTPPPPEAVPLLPRGPPEARPRPVHPQLTWYTTTSRQKDTIQRWELFLSLYCKDFFSWLSFIRVFQIWQNFPATFVGHYLTRQRWWHPVLDDWRWEYEADKHPKLAGILYLKMIIFVRRLQLHRPGSHSQCLSISPNWVLSYLSH